MPWTNSENCGTSLTQYISKSKRPGYIKESLIQPTMMLCRELQKTVNVLPFEKYIYSLFFQLWNNYIRQSHQNVKMAMNLNTIFIS